MLSTKDKCKVLDFFVCNLLISFLFLQWFVKLYIFKFHDILVQLKDMFSMAFINFPLKCINIYWEELIFYSFKLFSSWAPNLFAFTIDSRLFSHAIYLDTVSPLSTLPSFLPRPFPPDSLPLWSLIFSEENNFLTNVVTTFFLGNQEGCMPVCIFPCMLSAK